MKPKPFEIIVEFTPQCTKTGITYEMHQKGSLIRCKDCIHYSRISIGEKKLEIGRCTCQDVWDSIRARLSVMDEIEYIQVSADDFCSNAEPKDNRK